jgi:hypothetical protein
MVKDNIRGKCPPAAPRFQAPVQAFGLAPRDVPPQALRDRPPLSTTSAPARPQFSPHGNQTATRAGQHAVSQSAVAATVQNVQPPLPPGRVAPASTRVAQPRAVTAGSMLKQPLLPPPVYRPQQAPMVAQPKSSWPQGPQTGKAPHPPVAPRVYAPEAKKLVQSEGAITVASVARGSAPAATRTPHILQLMEDTGYEGGKGGVWYSSLSLTYSQEEIDIALAQLGLSGVKGHHRGKKGSKQSGQTTHELELLTEQLRTNRAQADEKRKGCNRFHNKRNMDKRCPHCGKESDEWD